MHFIHALLKIGLLVCLPLVCASPIYSPTDDLPNQDVLGWHVKLPEEWFKNERAELAIRKFYKDHPDDEVRLSATPRPIQWRFSKISSEEAAKLPWPHRDYKNIVQYYAEAFGPYGGHKRNGRHGWVLLPQEPGGKLHGLFTAVSDQLGDPCPYALGHAKESVPHYPYCSRCFATPEKSVAANSDPSLPSQTPSSSVQAPHTDNNDDSHPILPLFKASAESSASKSGDSDPTTPQRSWWKLNPFRGPSPSLGFNNKETSETPTLPLYNPGRRS
ncbi:hypothetical protein EV361DRAFT_963313 [Lentinula raphanica]|nr:hypothetical protein EV361DRAFT_963313 [Lentinula raphanica]